MLYLQFVEAREVTKSVVLNQRAEWRTHFNRIGKPDCVIDWKNSGYDSGKILRVKGRSFLGGTGPGASWHCRGANEGCRLFMAASRRVRAVLLVERKVYPD
jgi:hypothetical protein